MALRIDGNVSELARAERRAPLQPNVTWAPRTSIDKIDGFAPAAPIDPVI